MRATPWVAAMSCALLAGCAPGTPPQPPPLDPATPVLTGQPMDDLPPAPPAPSWSGTYTPPTWDEPAVTAATTHAEATVRAYLDTGLGKSAWWESLQPLLTIEAQARHDSTDPAAITPAEVEEGSTIVSPIDDAHRFQAVVRVPTTRGVFEITLHRQSGNDWLTAQITHPQPTS